MSAYAAASMDRSLNAFDIAQQTREQSRKLAHAELGRFIELLALLDNSDWDKPTACSLWSVRDIVAHQASHVQMGYGFAGWLSQVLAPSTLRYLIRGLSALDALNQSQVNMRRDRPVADVIEELRVGTPKAIEARQHAWWPGLQVRFPFAPFGMLSIGKLLDVILPRDMWMHRHDIASATGKPFIQTAEHDGIIVEKAVLDAAIFAAPRLSKFEIHLTLHGISGGSWRFGSGTPVSLAIDAIDFMRRSSERLSVEDALQVTESDAGTETKRKILSVLLAPY